MSSFAPAVLVVALLTFPSGGFAQDAGPVGDWQVGDAVEAYVNFDWLPARIIQIGGSPFADDPYLVQYGQPIGGNYAKRWLGIDDMRPAAAEPEAEAHVGGPRTGRYTILSYGNPTQPPIRLGTIELLTGTAYRYLDAGGNLLGEGEYAFIPGSCSVQWRTGILNDQGWGGEFTIEREGRTHKIRLMRSTIAVHSTD